MIKVLKKGLHTSIQDSGRIGFRNWGVPISGAMDSNAAKWSNTILGNQEHSAVIEITWQGPILQFLTATNIAITGAYLSPTLNGEPINNNKRINIKKNDVLGFGKRIKCVRSYLAVAGGWQTDSVMGSKSNYQQITHSAVINNEDEISFYTSFKENNPHFAIPPQIHYDNPSNLEVYKGPEFHLLNQIHKEQLSSNNFSIGINSRMGYQLQEILENKLTDRLSSAVLPGTVQLTPSGKLIILMRDCQTTGGYPRILQLTEAAINTLAQKTQREFIRFNLINENT